MLLWAAVVWSSCLLSRWLGRQSSVLFVYCETIENHFPISLDEAETTEHERFSTTAARSRWLIASLAARWGMTALWGDGTCHWQTMMHQIGHRYKLVQAHTPIFNNLMSDAGELTSSFWFFVFRDPPIVLRKDGIRKNLLYFFQITKTPKDLDSDPEWPFHWLEVNKKE